MVELTQELYESTDKMIWSLVKKYMNQAQRDVMWRITAQDLHQEGVIALANACKKFDENQGTKFTTYAYLAIDNQLKAYIRENARAFSISQNTNKLIVQIDRLEKQGLSTEEIARELEISETEVLETTGLNVFSYSTDFEIDGKDNSDMPFTDLIPAGDPDTDYQTKIQEILKMLIEGIPSLTEQDRIMYYQYNGILGYEKKTKKEIASESGMPIREFNTRFARTQRRIKREIENKYKKLI